MLTTPSLVEATFPGQGFSMASKERA